MLGNGGITMEPTAKERKEAVRELMSLNKQHRRMIENKLNQTGVFRAQHHLLMYLSDHKGCSQTEIARAEGISPASVAVSLKKLEKGGYITKAVDGEDNRYHKVILTKKGCEIVKLSHEMFEQLDEQLFLGFSLEELSALTDFIHRMQQNMAAK